MKHPTLDELWEADPPPRGLFGDHAIAALPPAARRYLRHAIDEDAPLATAVRLRMHGEIKLKGWVPFEAEQVLRAERGFIWKARARMGLLPVRGADRLVDGAGEMDFRLFGVVPVMTAEGPEVTRSAAGRHQIESIWLPSALVGPEVAWTEEDLAHPHVQTRMADEESDLRFTIDEEGHLEACAMERWGNPEGEAWHYAPFGGVVEEERRFGAYRVPSKLRVGWHFGTERFESEGEFIRITVDEATFR